MEHTASIALNSPALLGVGAFCQWLAWRMRLPAILPLLLAGLLAQWGSQAIPLFALDAKGRLVMRTVEAPWSPEPGWKVVALVPAEPNGRNNGAGADASGNDDQKP